jgi:hypothetical protein
MNHFDEITKTDCDGYSPENVFFIIFYVFAEKCLFRGNSILLSSQRKTINDRNLTF